MPCSFGRCRSPTLTGSPSSGCEPAPAVGGRCPADVLHAWRDLATFEHVEGANAITAVVESGAGPIARRGAEVTRGIFDMLGARPLLGRLPGGGVGQEILIAEDMWRSAFAADPSILGRAIQFDQGTRTVAGIMPAAFHFPEWDTAFWVVVPEEAAKASRMAAYVKRAPGVPEGDAARVAAEVAHRSTRRPQVTGPSRLRSSGGISPSTGGRPFRRWAARSCWSAWCWPRTSRACF